MANEPSRLQRLLCHIAYILRRLLERCCPTLPLTPPKPTLNSFMPGQLSVLALVTPPQGAPPNDRDWVPPREQIAARLREQLVPLLGGERAIMDPSRLVILRSASQAQAVMFVSLPDLRNDPARLLALIDQINRRMEARDIPDREPERPDLQSSGAEAQGSGGQNPPGPQFSWQMQLRVASPNWLGSASQQIGTTGGPGAHPVLVDPPQVIPSGSTPPWVYTIPSEMLPATASGTGRRPVTVAILDTMPHPRQLMRAHQRWVSQAPEAPHALLELLCGPAGAFAVGTNERLELTSSPIDLLAWVDADLEDHRYAMSDHGLFIAGIIASIAPDAHLYLVEALNPYGAGTLESLLWGLETVVERHQSNPDRAAALVINCSLMINSPAPDQEAIRRQAETSPDVATLTPARVLDLNRLLEEILAFARGLGDVVVVAAAGNDGTPRYKRPPARFPAAYREVVGVGALSTSDTPAVYSNTADAPSGHGFAVFGGDVVSNQPDVVEAHPDNGVLGVYIGATPDKLPNQSGWACWAGTSFAAPVISAVLASHLAAGQKAGQAVADLGAADTGSPFGGLFHVKQGS